jgi:hypothetical protein
MGNAVPFDEEPRQFQEQNEEQCRNVLLLGSQLAGLDDKSPNDSQDTPYENEKTEEFEEKIQKGPDGTRFKNMGKGESGNAMTPFHKITRGKSLDHVNDESGQKAKNEQGVGKPPIERLTEKFPMKEDVYDEDSDIPFGSSPEALPAPEQKDLEILQRSGILLPLYLSPKVKAESKTHSPQKEDEGRDEHGVEDEMFIHS